MTEQALREIIAENMAGLLAEYPEAIQDKDIAPFYYDVFVAICMAYLKSCTSKDKGNPIHGLGKMPDSVLIASLQREIGEFKSEVAHWKAEANKVSTNGRIQELNDILAKKNKKIEKLQRGNKQAIEEADGKVATANQTIARMQKEMLVLLKNQKE